MGGGEARGAALCAALLLGAVAPGPPAEDAAALRLRFEEAVAAGKDDDAQDAGRLLLAGHPDDPSCLGVLRTFHERGWKWPRLRTSFPVLRKWEQDAVDARKEPDLRIALIEALEALYPKEEAVEDGGTLYEKAWTHLQARRHEEAIRLGTSYLSRFPKGRNADRTRLLLAEALLARAPPDPAAAKRLLDAVAADPDSRQRARAARLLDDLASGARWIDAAEGRPRPEGLGRTALLTDLPEGDPLLEALAEWRAARRADVVRFRPGRPGDAADALRKAGPEFVAVATRPERVDFNLHADLLLLCRDLDGDPMPDFHFGYLVARDAADLRALAARSASTEPTEEARTAVLPVLRAPQEVAGHDAVLHFGHGTPVAVGGAVNADAAARCALPRGTVIVSGACFNGVVGRSWHPCARLPRFLPPVEYAPGDVLSLAWIHAGSRGVVAAMEGDRGEMAGAEWARFLETACPLGEIPGFSYRLAFASLPETFDGLPRQEAGKPRSLALYDVMLRGLLSRALIGDPAVRVLAKPTAPPAILASARREADGRLVVEVAPDTRRGEHAEAQFLFKNTLAATGFSGDHFTEFRLFARLEVPADVPGRPGRAEVRVEGPAGPIRTTRTSVRHEVWGGRRYVWVQAESADVALVRPGARAVFTFGGTR